MKRSLFNEGDWFSIPLGNTGHAVGVVARKPRNGNDVLGYFFGWYGRVAPTLKDVENYAPSEAVAICIFDDSALANGSWHVLGQAHAWIRDRWPVPDFGQQIPSGLGKSAQTWRVHYPDDDLNSSPTYTPITMDAYARLPRFGFYPPVAVERLLSSLPTNASVAKDLPEDDERDCSPTISHYLHFPSEMAAGRVVEQVKRDGYAGEISKSDSDWLVVVIYGGHATIEELANMEAQMESIALSHGGVYDGFDRTVKR